MSNADDALTFLDDPSNSGALVAAEESDDLLIIDDSDRYSRLRLISWWRQERLRDAKVLVVGAGALGNEVLKNLALLGIGTTWVIDKDDIEMSNLSRSVLFRSHDGGRSKAEVAAERMRDLNPDVQTIAIKGDVISDLGLGLFADVDVVIGCLDNREARLWVNRQCWKTSTPWIDSGIQEIQGVVKVFQPPESSCYECTMTTRDYQLLNLRYSCPLLRREDILEGKVPTAPTIASIMAALQVQEALKLIHGLPVNAGSAMVFNGVGNQFYTTKLPRREDCLSHETYPKPTPLPLSNHSQVGELFHAAQAFIHGPLSLTLERDLVIEIEYPNSGDRRPILKPSSRVPMSELIHPITSEHGRPVMTNMVEQGSALDHRSLAEVGIPPYDIIRVDGESSCGFFLLEADRANIYK